MLTRRLATSAVLVAAVLLLTPSAACAQAMPGDLPPKINKAIDNGVVWLKGRQIKNGAEKDSWERATIRSTRRCRPRPPALHRITASRSTRCSNATSILRIR